MSRQATFQTPTAEPAFTSNACCVLQGECAHRQYTWAGSEREECKRRREGALQRAVKLSPVYEVPRVVHEALHSSGRPLDAPMCAFMQPRLAYDFSRIPVH